MTERNGIKKMDRRKELIARYQQQKRTMGVYEIVNCMSGRRYIGSSLNLPPVWGRIRLQLQFGMCRDADMQKDWNDYGEDSFEFSVLEMLELSDEVRHDYKDIITPDGYRRDIAGGYRKRLEQLESKWRTKLNQ